jgi:hypothetical protein
MRKKVRRKCDELRIQKKFKKNSKKSLDFRFNSLILTANFAIKTEEILEKCTQRWPLSSVGTKGRPNLPHEDKQQIFSRSARIDRSGNEDIQAGGHCIPVGLMQEFDKLIMA